MRTRSASIFERTAIYVVIFVCLAANGGIYFHLNRNYQKERAEAEERLQKAQEELDKKKNEYDEKVKIRDTKRQEVDRKKKDDEQKQKELDATLTILNKTLVNLPPLDAWPDLVKKIEVLATDMRVSVKNFKVLPDEDPITEKIKKEFTKFKFSIYIIGEYSKIMEYLWTLENSIQLKEEGNPVTWKAIVKYSNFTIKQLCKKDDEGMELELELTTYFRGGQ